MARSSARRPARRDTPHHPATHHVGGHSGHAGGGGKKSSIAKYAIPVVAGGVLLYLLLRSPSANAANKKDSPIIPPHVDPGPPKPPGPRPPNTWGDLPTAIVQVTDPDPGASPGVRTRTAPSVTAALVPLGEGSQAYSAYSGKTVAVLETGIMDGAREWWKIITPGGYEGYASAGQSEDVAQANFRRAGVIPIPGDTLLVRKANAQGPGGGGGVAANGGALGTGPAFQALAGGGGARAGAFIPNLRARNPGVTVPANSPIYFEGAIKGEIGQTATVRVTGSNGVNTHTAPSTSAPYVQYNDAFNGRTVVVLEKGIVDDGGREWWKIMTPGGSVGYASAGDGGSNFHLFISHLRQRNPAITVPANTRTGRISWRR